MLMRANVRVETSDRAGRADSSNQVLILEKLKGAIDRCLRKTRQLLGKPDVNGFSRRMRKVFGKRSINCQTLRGDSNAARPAQLLEIGTPAIDVRACAARCACAGNSHVRIIIIWISLVKLRSKRVFRVPTLVGQCLTKVRYQRSLARPD